MKAYFTNLPTKTWLLLAVATVGLAYPCGSGRGPHRPARGCAGGGSLGPERDLSPPKPLEYLAEIA